MSWDKIEGHRSPCADSIRIAVHGPSGYNPYPQMRIHIGRGVLDKLRWNVDCMVNAFHGTGKDAGRIMVSLAENGRFKLVAKRGSVTGSVMFSTNRLPPGVADKVQRIKTAKFQIVPDGLEIEVPPSFYGKNDPSGRVNAVALGDNKAQPQRV